ncbi:glycosyltransferase family 4 protein [Halalkalicoccus subterraneus]|uniref:glycosyltransferase family 4 protein n=1 Tax=Halalkalicoccus subterraneus TaxID=2675002 RepID=UPI0013CE8A5B|nr:glycosyltransferase family 4 protein [Halalkalicoccus subterraneus]
MSLTIAFVHPSYPQSEGTGATHSASRIVFELAERGHEVTVYCRERPPEGADADVGDGVSVRPLDPSGYPYHTGFQLNDALCERAGELGDYDVVHSYVMNAMPALGRAVADTGVATVVTLNAYGAICPKNDLRYLDRNACTANGLAKCTACSIATSGGHDEYSASYRAASRMGYLELIRRGEAVADRIDGYHALSPHLRETYAEFGFPRERLTVIPNLADERFDRRHGSDFTEPYELLYVGSLDEHKGVERLLPVLSSLRRRSAVDFRLTVVGDGGLRSELKRRAEDEGVASAVSFTGWLPNEDLPAVFASHDLFVYPGQWDEPFGRVFLEALATGTPVVASDVGSVATIVGDGGRTTDGSVEGFVDVITGAVQDGVLPELSVRARERIKEYRADVVIPQFEALYEQCLSR